VRVGLERDRGRHRHRDLLLDARTALSFAGVETLGWASVRGAA
jgi:hypothetical protein